MSLTPEQREQFERDGYLVLPRFFDGTETSEMLSRAHTLLDTFDISNHPLTTFQTQADGKHIGDEYFLTSGDKVRYFLEPGSVTPATPTEPAKLNVPAARSVNKIGHGLAVLDPVFRKYTLENERVRGVARDLGAHEEPLVLQSMIICKQPKIGGTVPCHNDSTFLYTDPPSAVGFWIALDECTAENGCLSFLPGSHKSARISNRFVRASEGGTTFEPVPGVTPNEEQWDDMPGWKPAPCPPGTLVLIHGSVMHRSPPNTSAKTRIIYTFHMIEGKEGVVYDGRNWLQSEKAFARLF